MAGPLRDRLLDALWPRSGDRPEGEVYALLDGARDPLISAMLSRSLADSCCLYLGELSRARAEVAPYLVALSRDSPVAARLIEHGWGESWGVFLTSSAILQDLRRHFRRFLQVRDEAGRRMLFRFYDPRVLRVYLPTCTALESRSFFGPVDRYLVEGVTPDVMIEFRRSGSGPARHRLDLADGPGPGRDGPWEPSPGGRLPRGDRPRTPGSVPTIREEQMVAFRRAAESALPEQMPEFLRREHAWAVATLTDDEIRARARAGLERARHLGLDARSSLRAFLTLIFVVGPRFDEQRRIRRILTDGRYPPNVRMDLLLTRVSDRDWAEAERLDESSP